MTYIEPCQTNTPTSYSTAVGLITYPKLQRHLVVMFPKEPTTKAVHVRRHAKECMCQQPLCKHKPVFMWCWPRAPHSYNLNSSIREHLMSQSLLAAAGARGNSAEARGSTGCSPRAAAGAAHGSPGGAGQAGDQQQAAEQAAQGGRGGLCDRHGATCRAA